MSSPTTRSIAAAAVVGLLLVGFWSLQPHEPPSATTMPAAAAAPAPVEIAGVDVGTELAGPGPRREVAPPPVEMLAPPAATAFGRGHVLFDTGAPAVGARVCVGAATATADAQGAFALRLDRIDAAAALVATLPGYQPAVIGDLTAMRAGREFEVVLPGKAWGIDGWLLDATGAACAGWTLGLYRGTDCGPIAFPNLLAEDLAAGAQVRGRSVEHLGSNPNLQQIGADGAFRIGGLRRGCDYVLRAWNPRTLQTVFSAPIAAGISRYVFTVPPADCRERVTGRAVDRYGNALASVRVRLSMREHQSGGTTSYQTGQEVNTGLDGSFEFRQVPRQDLLLRFTGDDVESNYWELKADDPGVDLLIRLVCICRVRFEARATAADALRILDGDDRPLRLTRQLGEGRSEGGTDVAIVEGRSPELTVSDAAAWLSLSRGREVVQRVPIKLYRGEPAVLRD